MYIGIIIACTLLLGLSIYCYIKKSTKPNETGVIGFNRLTIFMYIVGLILLFEIVYAAFYYQVGLPPGEGLTAIDWLSFLGSYMGFSGSLLMAYLVYKQDEKINTLTLQEYQTTFNFQICYAEKIDKYTEANQCEYTVNPRHSPNEIFKKHDVKRVSADQADKSTSTDIPEVFIALTNVGRLTVTNLRFESLRLIPQSQEGTKEYCIEFAEEGGGNIWNGKHLLQPGGELKVCFVLNRFIQTVGTYHCFLNISYTIGSKTLPYIIDFFCSIQEVNAHIGYTFIDGICNPTC